MRHSWADASRTGDPFIHEWITIEMKVRNAKLCVQKGAA
jgi:hypothetical protein